MEWVTRVRGGARICATSCWWAGLGAGAPGLAAGCRAAGAVRGESSRRTRSCRRATRRHRRHSLRVGKRFFADRARDADRREIVRQGCRTATCPRRWSPRTTRRSPDESYKAGARQFPLLVPTQPDDPAIGRQPCGVGGAGKRWDKPFLTAFGDQDPIHARRRARAAEADPRRGRARPSDDRKVAATFLQEDCGRGSWRAWSSNSRRLDEDKQSIPVPPRSDLAAVRGLWCAGVEATRGYLVGHRMSVVLRSESATSSKRSRSFRTGTKSRSCWRAFELDPVGAADSSATRRRAMPEAACERSTARRCRRRRR